jgi:uncharacterized membrane protein
MSSSSPPAPSGLPVHRIEALSDGVFAIAMTLLVLELHVPELVDGAEGGLGRALLHMWPKLVSFALGFVLLGSFWVGQHYQLHYVRRTDRALLWLNLGLLLVCSLVPFGVALLGHYWANPVVCAVYGGLLVSAGGCLYATWSYATTNHRLVAPSLPAATIGALRGRIALGLLGYGLGLALSFVAPLASIVVYGLMPLLYLLPGRIDRHVKSAGEPTP